MLIWRISRHADLSGYGGFLSAARWNRQKTSIIYCADHPASALLEMLVHIDPEDAPNSYQLLSIDVPDGTAVHRPELPPDWRDDLTVTQKIGSDFIVDEQAPVLAAPSVIVPFATNYLLNPALLNAAGIRIAGVTRHPIDNRLLGLISR